MAMQNSLDSICLASHKNCCRCGKAFFDFSDSGRANVCLHCRRPAIRPIRGEVHAFGKPLSMRQEQIAEMISRGKPNKEIAFELSLALGTIKVFTSQIFMKTGCANRTALAVWWLQKSENLNG